MNTGDDRFIGHPSWLDMDPDGEEMVLQTDFAFLWGHYLVLCPGGNAADGLSVPRPLWALVGSPMRGPYRRAAIPHDGLYAGWAVVFDVDAIGLAAETICWRWREEPFPRIRPQEMGRGFADNCMLAGMGVCRKESKKATRITMIRIYAGVRAGGWVPWNRCRKAEGQTTHEGNGR